MLKIAVLYIFRQVGDIFYSIHYLLTHHWLLYLAKRSMHKADGDLKHCTAQFGRLVDYYCAKPPAGQSNVTMEHFFALCCPLVQDFRQHWERVMEKRCDMCEVYV